MIRPRLVVMLKEPRAGRVKTRLGRDIGMTTAAWWFRHQARSLLRRLDDPRWQMVLAVSPDREGLTSRVWPGHLGRIAQGRGDLGARMAGVFRRLAPGPVAIIGADIPGIERDHIQRAFAALGAHDATFGPATDGGYWLIGMAGRRAMPAGFLKRVRWSSPHALSDTIATLGPLTCSLGDCLPDVDEARDLARAPRLAARGN